MARAEVTIEPGVELIGRETLFAEGCRGSLTKTLVQRFRLRDGVDPQTYAIGIKELWEVAPDRHQPGLVVHTVGWPLDRMPAVDRNVLRLGIFELLWEEGVPACGPTLA